MSEEILAQSGDDNPTASPAEETTTTPTPASEEGESSDEEKQGSDFSKHPRWKEREDDWKERYNEQETRHSSELEKQREAFTKAPTVDSKIPSWFGGTEEDWNRYEAYNQDKIDKAQEVIREETQRQTDADQKAIDDATDYLNTEISTIESDTDLNPDKVKLDRNKLLKFVMDNELVDTKGRWNYRAGWQLMQAGIKSSKKATIDEKKQLAGASTEGGRAQSDDSDVTTSEHFKNPANRPW